MCVEERKEDKETEEDQDIRKQNEEKGNIQKVVRKEKGERQREQG